ncbi:hypothetical protein N4G58_04180 [Edwardsiella piscicida]|nr:hypothetical protein N4G58_04180 [Edwardsiella piscicida]
MAVVDIFEALTASDRPYKPAKTLSQTLTIMSEMCRREHIDADVFCLFLQSGVYLDYAKRYLRPEQMDRVDIAMLINNCRGNRIGAQRPHRYKEKGHALAMGMPF